MLFKYRGEDIINIYNPKMKDQGYRSEYSILEILTKDKAFLIDTLKIFFVKLNLSANFVCHPIYSCKQNTKKQITSISGVVKPDADNISVIHIEFDRIKTAKLESIKKKVIKVLNKLTQTNNDWQSMQSKMLEVIEITQKNKVTSKDPKTKCSLDFLRWILDDNFTFLGYRKYIIDANKLEPINKSGLGVLKRKSSKKASDSFSRLPDNLKEKALKPNLIFISKSNKLSDIHRNSYMDYIGIKEFNAKGEVIAEHKFLGLMTAKAYHYMPKDIPLISQKVEKIISSLGVTDKSHAKKEYNNIIAQIPRDELVQAPSSHIKTMLTSLYHFEKSKHLLFFVRKDIFEGYISCYVYVPSDNYSTNLEGKIKDYLSGEMNANSVKTNIVFTDNMYMYMHFLLRVTPGEVAKYNKVKIEKQLKFMVRDWSSVVFGLLEENIGKSAANNIFKKYSNKIPTSYKENFSQQQAEKDLILLDSLTKDKPLNLKLYKKEQAKSNLRLKLYGLDEVANLSDLVPILENFGFTVKSATPYQFSDDGCNVGWIVEFILGIDFELKADLADLENNFVNSFLSIWNKTSETDVLDKLTLSKGINYRDVTLLRAVAKYMQQAKAPYSIFYIYQAIDNNPEIAQDLVELFHTRMETGVKKSRDERTEKVLKKLKTKFKKVSSLDEDRILRWFVIVIQAMLRTNFFQLDKSKNHKEVLSFKLESAKIPDLPLPKPMYEIFVYSSSFEAIHLRGGKVARGGLRWSDRKEDFRTEVLGLVKAQIVKNAVIVPVGSKGGFFVKNPDNSSRDAFMAEGIRCYKMFISGLLDITDNIVAGKTVAPKNVYRHDGNDPYLVVAADKGTATFSDIANGVAREYGFWLDDAFASGGSVGYDHKGMGITARGAWESVKRHFRHLGKDIQKQEFSVVGIGDMGGDVFGNGMLLSKKIKLTAAFNHIHIFIDPTPNSDKTFVERKRLFETPRTTWDDFDKKLMSKGGGVFSRADKVIKITPEMQKVFDIKEKQLSPNQLINRLLKAPVELLWNGGIGTYVKSESESNQDVGDKANDSLRINGSELRCKVIGEGGNLGFTQLGRVEYAQNGGMILTDAIDNSAGVTCSDHEVNIKILLNQSVEAGDMTVKQRNTLLAKMTDEVGRLVLRQNYQQPQAISIGLSQKSLFIDQVRIMRQLEKEGRLSREVEFLPTDKEIKQRLANNEVFTAPELAILLAYSKISLFDELVSSNLSEADLFKTNLNLYFPKPLRKKYAPQMQTHPLQKEIAATFLTNSILNHMGPIFIYRKKEETGQTACQIVLAYCAALEVTNARFYWNLVDELDNEINADLQNKLHLQIRNTLEKVSTWLLLNRRDSIDIVKIKEEFTDVIKISKLLPNLISAETKKDMNERISKLVKGGVDKTIATEITYLSYAVRSLDIINLAKEMKQPVENVAKLYFKLSKKLDIRWLRKSIKDLYDNDYWRRRACSSLMQNLMSNLVKITTNAALLDKNTEKAINKWSEKSENLLTSYTNCIKEVSAGDIDISRLSVAIGELSELAK